MSTTLAHVDREHVARTVAVYRARAAVAAAVLHLDDLMGGLSPDVRERHDFDYRTFTAAARQLEAHLALDER